MGSVNLAFVLVSKSPANLNFKFENKALETIVYVSGLSFEI